MGSPSVTFRVSLFISVFRVNLVLTYLRDSSRVPRRRPFIHLNRHTPSGQSRVYRVTQLRNDGVHCRESGTGPVVVLKDHSFYESLFSHTHYWYVVDMLCHNTTESVEGGVPAWRLRCSKCTAVVQLWVSPRYHTTTVDPMLLHRHRWGTRLNPRKRLGLARSGAHYYERRVFIQYWSVKVVLLAKHEQRSTPWLVDRPLSQINYKY